MLKYFEKKVTFFCFEASSDNKIRKHFLEQSLIIWFRLCHYNYYPKPCEKAYFAHFY
ncbi:hypothetical protein BCL90_1409 [Pedobacter alluvionis]|uniref:Uncharacterized protein n=1 Tax=Pedobacter alluvionis TaxID=475253 RepID=A0A497YD57_9SPHI|nr:hypothetical protein BCL90_1409 [Pedobacter alluvionis]